MQNWTHITDKALLLELSKRLSQRRLELDLTQAAMAKEAGVSKRTVERIESGNTTQLSSLIRILRVLGFLSNIDAWIPPTAASPMEQLQNIRGSKQRRRASSTEKAKTDQNEVPWIWGDES